MNLEKEVFEININDIMPNRFQPREVFDEESINELSQSIKEHGVIQPIIVRKIGDKYEIVAGERRYRASQIAGKTTIPALVRNIDDRETAKIALLENLQRKNLTAIEEARTYQTILKLDNLTQEELANSLGKSQSAIANKLRLLNLDQEVQEALLNGQISERHARSLLNLPNKELQKNMLEKILTNRMTVKQLDDEISMMTGKQMLNNEEFIEKNEDVDADKNTFSNLATTNEEKVVIDDLIKKEEPNSVDIFASQYANLKEDVEVNDTLKTGEIFSSEEVPSVTSANEILDSIDNLFARQDSETKEKLEKNEEIESIYKPDVKIQEEPKFVYSFEQEPLVKAPEKVETPKYSFEQEEPKKEEVITRKPYSFEINVEEKPKIIEEKQQNLAEPKILEKPIVKEQEEKSKTPNNDIYDLRFAINNFRQAVQNTEKFGFNVDTEEFDFDNVYQIIIKIDKNK